MTILEKIFSNNPPPDLIDNLQNKIVKTELIQLLESGKKNGFSNDLLLYMMPEYTDGLFELLQEEKHIYLLKQLQQWKKSQRFCIIQIAGHVCPHPPMVYHTFEQLFDRHHIDPQDLEYIIEKTCSKEYNSMLSYHAHVSTAFDGITFVFHQVKKTLPDRDGMYDIDYIQRAAVIRQFAGLDMALDLIKHTSPKKSLFDIFAIPREQIL